MALIIRKSNEQDWLMIFLKYPFQDRLLSCWKNSFIAILNKEEET